MAVWDMLKKILIIGGGAVVGGIIGGCIGGPGGAAVGIVVGLLVGILIAGATSFYITENATHPFYQGH